MDPLYQPTGFYITFPSKTLPTTFPPHDIPPEDFIVTGSAESDDDNKSVTVDDNECDVPKLHEMFGKGLDLQINALFIAGLVPFLVPQRASFQPHRSQMVGATKVMHLLTKGYNAGCQLLDGLGCEVRATVVLTILMLLEHDIKKPNQSGKRPAIPRGPILLVTTQSLVTEWARELQDKVVQENALKVLVLTAKVRRAAARSSIASMFFFTDPLIARTAYCNTM